MVGYELTLWTDVPDGSLFYKNDGTATLWHKLQAGVFGTHNAAVLVSIAGGPAPGSPGDIANGDYVISADNATVSP